MLNEVTLMGNLGRDPEIRAMQDGRKVANVSLATSERWKDKNSGEWQERTEWHRICAFGPLAEVFERRTEKGSLVWLRGKMQTRKWTDQSGNDRYTTEIVLSGFDAKLRVINGKKSDDGPQYGDHRSGGYEPPAGDLDDEIPFIAWGDRQEKTIA